MHLSSKPSDVILHALVLVSPSRMMYYPLFYYLDLLKAHALFVHSSKCTLEVFYFTSVSQTPAQKPHNWMELVWNIVRSKVQYMPCTEYIIPYRSQTRGVLSLGTGSGTEIVNLG